MTLQPTIPVAEIGLDGPISCLSFFPENQHILLVGIYELHDVGEQDKSGNPQVRSGRIVTLEVDEHLLVHPHICTVASFGLESLTINSKIIHVEQVSAGILDLRFSPVRSTDVAVATSVGRVDLYHLHPESLGLTRMRSFNLTVDSALVLHLDWQPQAPTAQHSRIAVTLSDGRIAVSEASEGKHGTAFIQAHSLEAWFVAWDPLEPRSIYSGGDDSCFCVSSLPIDDVGGAEVDESNGVSANEVTNHPLYCNRKFHYAGVTSILPFPLTIDGHKIVLTGSYDETLRVLRAENGRQNWKIDFEMALGGGVWRLQILEHKEVKSEGTWSLTILASCMHAGPKIVQLNFRASMPLSARVVAEFAGHSSMNYASDARQERTRDWTIVSSSFYDKKLCLWRLGNIDGAN